MAIETDCFILRLNFKLYCHILVALEQLIIKIMSCISSRNSNPQPYSLPTLPTLHLKGKTSLTELHVHVHTTCTMNTMLAFTCSKKRSFSTIPYRITLRISRNTWPGERLKAMAPPLHYSRYMYVWPLIAFSMKSTKVQTLPKVMLYVYRAPCREVKPLARDIITVVNTEQLYNGI